MKKNVHRMKFLHIVWWTLYLVFTRTFFAALVLLVAGFFAVPFSLDEVLHVSFTTLLKIYLLALGLYLVLEISKKLIYFRFDNEKLIAWSLFRRYTFKWSEIESVDKVIKDQKWTGISQGDSSAVREMLKIKTKRNVFTIDLSLKSMSGFFMESFPFSGDLVSGMRNYWLNATTIFGG